MVEQRNYLSEAREALADTSVPARQRLQRAAGLFRQAYVYQGSRWPQSLREQGESILIRLVADGRMVKNLAEMDERMIMELCRDLARLLDDQQPL
jgi:hypothetical protein